MKTTFIQRRAKAAAQSVEIAQSPMNAYPIYLSDGLAFEVGDAVIRSLRDLPHDVLDATRCSIAPEDAAQFWNRVIDHISPER